MHDDEPLDENLGDNVAIRDSMEHPGRKVAVAQKGPVDVCWNCFEPLRLDVRDVPAGTTFVRVCNKHPCIDAVFDELRSRGTEA